MPNGLKVRLTKVTTTWKLAFLPLRAGDVPLYIISQLCPCDPNANSHHDDQTKINQTLNNRLTKQYMATITAAKVSAKFCDDFNGDYNNQATNSNAGQKMS